VAGPGHDLARGHAVSGARRLRARAGWWARWLVAGRNFERRLVWILGSPRSGSTWLLQLLDEHDAVTAVNEPLIGLYLGPFLIDLPGWRADAVDTTNFTVRKVEERNPNQFFAAQFRDVWRPALRRMLVTRFFAHAIRAESSVPLARRTVAIKEPNGSQSADILADALPGSRLLFLVRDGRDVVDSELAANQSGSWLATIFPGAGGAAELDRMAFVTQSAHKWLVRTEVVQSAFARHEGPKYQLRYEDLLRDPAGETRKLLDWLELPVADAELESWIDRHAFERIPETERGQSKFHRAASPGLWRENLSEDEQRAVEQMLGPKLRELGYA
jgi:hypothetical protein